MTDDLLESILVSDSQVQPSSPNSPGRTIEEREIAAALQLQQQEQE